MKKLPLPIIPEDKSNHFIYGSFIYSVSCLLLPIVYSIIIVALIAALKEWHDKYVVGSKPDIMDWIWTMLGCLPVMLIQIK